MRWRNTGRLHGYLGDIPPAESETALYAQPNANCWPASNSASLHQTQGDSTTHFQVRYDHVATNGKISFRRATRMHHLGIGTEHRGKRCILITDDTTVTVVHLPTGEILAINTIDPDKTYWRNTMSAPGRWPGALRT